MTGKGAALLRRWKSSRLRAHFWETSKPIFQWFRRHRRWPPWGSLPLGDLGRPHPVRSDARIAAGLSVHDFYERCLWTAHEEDLYGRVLVAATDPSIFDQWWRERSGQKTSQDPVTELQGLQIGRHGDIPTLPETRFNCVVCSRAVACVNEPAALMRALHSALIPGGVLLLTAPGIGRSDAGDPQSASVSWFMTSASARRLLEEIFAPARISVETFGNALSATAMLHGLAADLLQPRELNYVDPDYHVIIGVRAERLGSDA